MKKLVLALSLVSAVTFSPARSFAEDAPSDVPLPQYSEHEERPSFEDRRESGEGRPRKMQKGKEGGQNKMMGMMMHRQVIATSDGGVVILSGKKLVKYDARLNLVGEVDLKDEKPGDKAGEKPRAAAVEIPAPAAEETAPAAAPAAEEPAPAPAG